MWLCRHKTPMRTIENPQSFKVRLAKAPPPQTKRDRHSSTRKHVWGTPDSTSRKQTQSYSTATWAISNQKGKMSQKGQQKARRTTVIRKPLSGSKTRFDLRHTHSPQETEELPTCSWLEPPQTSDCFCFRFLSLNRSLLSSCPYLTIAPRVSSVTRPDTDQKIMDFKSEAIKG